jgi:hypothetical protein
MLSNFGGLVYHIIWISGILIAGVQDFAMKNTFVKKLYSQKSHETDELDLKND